MSYDSIEELSNKHFWNIPKKKIKKLKKTSIKANKKLERRIRRFGDKIYKRYKIRRGRNEKKVVHNQNDDEYLLLLENFYKALEKKNPELYYEQFHKEYWKAKPPKIGREPKKTIILNYDEICESFRRLEIHIRRFILSELEAQGSIDSNRRLVIKGIFYQKDLENVLKNYIRKYVQCQECGKFNTKLSRDCNTRLHYLVCENCKAKRNVR